MSSRALLLLVFFGAHPFCAYLASAQSAGSSSAASSDNDSAVVQQLFAAERWQEVVRLAEAAPGRSAELDYYYGVALAHLERWSEARNALLAGSRMRPEDKRFPIELGGIAFRQKNYPQAIVYLRKALRLDPRDVYANDFVATVFFLQGNIQAALKYWNRAGKPEVEMMRSEPLPRVNSVLLDRAFDFAPASTLLLPQLLATEVRIQALEIFSTHRLDLRALPDGKFDAVFLNQERNGWGRGKVQGLLNLFRGLPYQEVNPEYFNLSRSATNLVSLVRWDAQKRRLWASASGPLGVDPRWRYRVGVDLREENWEIRDSFKGDPPLLGALNLRKEELGADVTRFVGARFNWSIGGRFSFRDYRSVVAGSALTPQLLAKGYELKQIAKLNADLWRRPEKRFNISGELSSQVGRTWSAPAMSFAKLQASTLSHWFPRSTGDDFETAWRLKSGTILGRGPFDELFMLGMERDNDLWLRAHIGTRNGRKGSAPLGEAYFLSNWDCYKSLYGNGIFSLKAGPLLDTGRISRLTSALGPEKWLWDTGAQVKVTVLGMSLVVVYGKDLRSGNNTFYTTIAR